MKNYKIVEQQKEIFPESFIIGIVIALIFCSILIFFSQIYIYARAQHTKAAIAEIYAHPIAPEPITRQLAEVPKPTTKK